MDGWEKYLMGILDLYLQPSLIPDRSQDLKRLQKGKTENKRHHCIHDFHYEKWIHKGRKEGVKDTYHYKEVCNKCGIRRCVERTKEIYELVKDQIWHYKKKKIKH